MNDEIIDKTLYDGRMQFHRRLDSLWTNFYLSLINKNYDGVYTAFNGVLIETSGLITDEKTNEFVKKLDSIFLKARMLNNGQKINQNCVSDFSIQREFRDLALDIRQLTKRLYLPLEEFDTGFDEEKFLKESEG